VKVIVARSAGFCRGVQRAVDRARAVAGETDLPVWTDGPLIHNRQIINDLEREGIREAERPEDLAEGTLVVRAHGIPPERRRRLKALPVTLIDATCPDVARIQGLIRRHVRAGHEILVFGDRGHAEVVGLEGFAEGRAHVLSAPEDVAALPPFERVCLVSQSTQFPFAYARIADAVRARYPGAVVLDTICPSTRARQQELEALAPRVDAFVIVGGQHSANTLRLVELAATLAPTHHVQTADQLNPSDFRTCRVAGLTGGASTPLYLIDSVRERLESYGTVSDATSDSASRAGRRTP
jgi:4-hydroxy-3-methylbut-2-enyl diphosphate reductase